MSIQLVRPLRKSAHFAILPIILLWLQLVTFVSCSGPEPDTLICSQQNRTILIDGRASLLEWYGIDSVQVVAENGANLPDGKTVITIKAQRVGRSINFLFKWSDPTRSYNRMLEKRNDGWYKLASDLTDGESENSYWEDELAVSFHKDQINCTNSCHTVKTAKPESSFVSADIWVWQSVSSNPSVQAKDAWYNDYDQSINYENLAGGGAKSNLNVDWNEPYFLPTGPYSRFWINLVDENAKFYRPEFDRFQEGRTIPGVVVAPMMGDIADVRAFGMWRGREWVVEMSRQLSTGSNLDFQLRDTLYLNIAVFDNSQKEHALTSVPVRVVIE